MLPIYSMPTSVPLARSDLDAPHHAHHGRFVVQKRRASSFLEPLFHLTPASPPGHVGHANTSPSPSEHSLFHHKHHHRHHHGAEYISGPISAEPRPAHVPTKDELRAHLTGHAEKEKEEVHVLQEITEAKLVKVIDIRDPSNLLHPEHARDPARALMRVNTAPVEMQHRVHPARHHQTEPMYPASAKPHVSANHRGRETDRSPTAISHRSRSASPAGRRRSVSGHPTRILHKQSSMHSLRSVRSGHSSSSTRRGAFHGPRNPPIPLMPARIPPRFSIVNDLFPFLAPVKRAWLWLRRHTESSQTTMRRHHKAQLKRNRYESDNVPLELILHFSNYVSVLQQRKIMDVPTTTALLNCLTGLQQQLTSLEKILSTPIPLAYQLHLKHATMIYLLVLPFQLQPILGYNAIPAVLIASFMFLGFLAIGEQIESPFGYDRNDLDLDEYCQNVIAKEIKEISAHPPLDPASYIFSHSNEPLAPADCRSALQLMEDQVSRAECEKALLKGHERDRGWRLTRARMDSLRKDAFDV